MHRSLIDLFPQFAVVEACQQRLLCGVDDDDAVRRLAAPTLRILLTLRNISLTQSGELFYIVHPHGRPIGGFREQIAPLLLELRDTVVDLLHPLHLAVVEQRPLPYERIVDLIEQFFVFTLEIGIFVVVHKLDALEKFFVEENLIFEFRQERCHDALRLGYLRCFVSAHQCEENV